MPEIVGENASLPTEKNNPEEAKKEGIIDWLNRSMNEKRHLVARVMFAVGLVALLASYAFFLTYQDLIQQGTNAEWIQTVNANCHNATPPGKLVFSCQTDENIYRREAQQRNDSFGNSIFPIEVVNNG